MPPLPTEKARGRPRKKGDEEEASAKIPSEWTVPGSQSTKIIISHIRSINLNEQISPDKGTYTNISILGPAIHIERAKKEPSSFGGSGRSPWDYRITTSFSLQVEICDFDRQFVLASLTSFLVFRFGKVARRLHSLTILIGIKNSIDFLTPYL